MKKQTGFTLIELAIVLVIIGLLLGGVLKGQELINSAKVKNLANDFRTIPVYIYGYQDKFKALPGDDKAAQAHLGDTSVLQGNGDGALGGNWFDAGANNASEAYQFWRHVRLANLAPGVTDIANPDWRPTNADGNPIGIMAGTNDVNKTAMLDTAATPAAIKGSYVICSKGILGKYVTQLDVTMDDGNSGTGSMMAAPTAATDALKMQSTSTIDPAASYTVCYGI
jgi:prepilin-type N-terminal cleavage/methylation domain-containing protein